MIQLSWELELGVFQYHFPILSSNLTVLCVLPKLMQLLLTAGIRRPDWSKLFEVHAKTKTIV